METLQTKKFDEQLIKKITHLEKYPEMLPFIGKNWEISKKILLIGESHYLPFNEIKEYSDFDFDKNWYEGNSSGLDENHKKYITTRNNVITLEKGKYEKPLALYFNIKRAVLEVGELTGSNMVFDKFSFYNYFQKPAYVFEQKNEDRSIKPIELDKKIAFETFNKIIEIIEPKFIIFISKKSFNSFNQSRLQNNIPFKEIFIDYVPHAGRPWWNRTSKEYGNKTGKQKFMDIIQYSNCANKKDIFNL